MTQETKLFKHTYKPIPFEYTVKSNCHIQAVRGSPLDVWLEQNGFIRGVAGFCPLHLIESEEFKNKWIDSPGYIVGKGPSLDYLSANHFKNHKAPILAVNESILKIKEFRLPNPIFHIQADIPEFIYTTADDYKILVHKAGHFYHTLPNVWIVEADRSPMFLTSLYAIRVAKYFGCFNIVLICFDAFDTIAGYSKEMEKYVNSVSLSKVNAGIHLKAVEKIKIVLQELYPNYEKLRPLKDSPN